MKIINQSRNVCLASSVIMADSFFPRLVGLLGRPCLAPGCCLVLKPCRSVHTVFMQFAIDVLFVDGKGTVVSLKSDMLPYRLSGIVREARLAIELPAGTLAATGTSAGDTIIFTAG